MRVVKQIFHATRRLLARMYLPLMGVTQIAITGSQGKTALTQTLYALLKPIRPTVVTDINLDTIYNVPITALRTRPWHQYVLFELGIDKIGEMDTHLEIVHPDIAVVTGISSVHSDATHMGSEKQVVIEKSRLPQAVNGKGVVVLNYSDEKVRSMRDGLRARVLWYGKEEDYESRLGKDYVGYSQVRVSLKGTSFTLHDHEKKISISVSTHLLGTFHAQTLTAAYLVLKHLNPHFATNYPDSVMEHIHPLTGRMSLQDGPKHTIILNDSLRANPVSTSAGLQTFADIEYKKGRKVVILADMGELENPKRDHQAIGKLLGGLNIDMAICVGKMQQFTAETLKAKKPHQMVYHFKTIEEAKKEVLSLIQENDFIYLKGSLYSRVGKVLESEQN